MTAAPDRPVRPPESVWDYPRPPRAEPDHRRAVLRHGGVVVADTTDLVRILETSHPPTFYLPRTRLRRATSCRPGRTTFCEWKGVARYVDLVVPGVAPLRDVGWWYPEPDPRYPQLRDRVAVYAGPFDEITLDGERVAPQPGGFYGGWITARSSARSRVAPAPGAGDRACTRRPPAAAHRAG